MDNMEGASYYGRSCDDVMPDCDPQLVEMIRDILLPETNALKKQLEEARLRETKLRNIIAEQSIIVKDSRLVIQMYEKQRVKDSIFRSMECKATQTVVTGLPERQLPPSVLEYKPVLQTSSSSRTLQDVKPIIDVNDIKRQRLANSIINRQSQQLLQNGFKATKLPSLVSHNGLDIRHEVRKSFTELPVVVPQENRLDDNTPVFTSEATSSISWNHAVKEDDDIITEDFSLGAQEIIRRAFQANCNSKVKTEQPE